MRAVLFSDCFVEYSVCMVCRYNIWVKGPGRRLWVQQCLYKKTTFGQHLGVWHGWPKPHWPLFNVFHCLVSSLKDEIWFTIFLSPPETNNICYHFRHFNFAKSETCQGDCLAEEAIVIAPLASVCSSLWSVQHLTLLDLETRPFLEGFDTQICCLSAHRSHDSSPFLWIITLSHD